MDLELARRLCSLDARVREQAGLDLVYRLGADPSLEAALVKHLEEERDEEALSAIVRALPGDTSLELRAACRTRLDRAGPALRAAIFDRVLAWTPSTFPESLRARAPHESDAVLRGHLIDAWMARLGARDAVAALAAAPYPVLADALARAPIGALGWDELAPIVARGIPVLEPLVLPHIADADHPVRQRLLANIVARALEPATLAAPLRRDLAARALGLLDPVIDRAGKASPLEADVLKRLLGAAERILARADPDQLDAAEHELLGRVGRIRRRAGTRDPHGWLGAAMNVRRDRGPVTVIEHTLPTGTSTVNVSIAGLELRSLREDVRALASSLPLEEAARPLLALAYSQREVLLDPAILRAAIARAIPARPALADDLARIADAAIARSCALRAELIEGWCDDPEDTLADGERATLLEPDLDGSATD